MSKDSIIHSPISDVTFHLEEHEFNGPLDLLLTMVREAKIEIRDIFISDITSQFVEYVKNLEGELDYEYVAEYIIMASTLLSIKSSRLLPKSDLTQEEIDIIEQSEEDFYQKMEIYKKFKDAAEKLKEREVLYRFYAVPKFSDDDFRTVVKNFNLQKLIDCFKNLLERIEHLDKDIQVKTIIKERFTISDKILEITNLIREKTKINFFNLFKKDYSKMEMINTFLAVLEILKKQIAFAEQEKAFSDIIIKYNKEQDINQEELTKDAEQYN
ncbi:MAG: segregation/condensation protein A [Bacillota bacterium]|jgi:segregation and condensation protein A|nr:segregation/condensation protein A [Bacillota bacterium]HHU42881.1 segregation/condensation protein A [Clostridiales bacterium]